MMSHLARNMVEGLDESKVNFEIVGKAIDLMAKAKLGHRVNKIKYWHNEIDCKGIGFVMNQDDYGIDLYMDGEKLMKAHESMAHQYNKGGAFQREFQKAYTAAAIQSYVQTMGYSVGEAEVKGKDSKEYVFVGSGF